MKNPSKFKFSTLVITTALAYFVSLPAIAEQQIDYSKDTITGNWNGTRMSGGKGIDTEIVYTTTAWSNVSGGIKEGSRILDNLDVTLTFDGSKLYNVEGSTIFIYLLAVGQIKIMQEVRLGLTIRKQEPALANYTKHGQNRIFLKTQYQFVPVFMI